MARRKRARIKQRVEGQREEILTRLLGLRDDKESKHSTKIRKMWTRLLRLLDDDEVGAVLAALKAELDGDAPVSLKMSMLSSQAMHKMMNASTTKERRILGFTALERQKEAKADQEIRHIRDVVLGRVQAKDICDRMYRLLASHLTSKQVVKLESGLSKLCDLIRRVGRVFGLGGVRPR